MPSITIRFDWDQTVPYSDGTEGRTLAEMSSYLQHSILEAYTVGGPDMMGYAGPVVDEVTLDAIIDDGHGITHADRERAALDDEHEARAAARVEEYHTDEA